MLRDTETTETEQETTETEHHQIALPSPNLASTKEQKKRRRWHDYLPPSIDYLEQGAPVYSLNFSILVCLPV